VAATGSVAASSQSRVKTLSLASVAAAADGLAHVLSLEATAAAPAGGGKLLCEDKDGPRDCRPAEHEEHHCERKVVPRHFRFSYRPPSREPLAPDYNESVSVVALVLIACAVGLVVGAEWPRLAGRVARAERHRPVRRKRRRGKGDLTLVEGEAGDAGEFERSVARDLENLPVLGEPDDRSRR
jgi:hypothetical protein